MLNTMYYAWCQNNKHEETLQKSLVKSLALIKQKGRSNIKLVVNSLDVLDVYNPLIKTIDRFWLNGEGTKLSKTRNLTIDDFPGPGQKTGINVISSNKGATVVHSKSSGYLVVWGTEDSITKVQNAIHFEKVDVVVAIWNMTSEIADILSAHKAIPIADESADINPFEITQLPEHSADILHRLTSLDSTQGGNHRFSQQHTSSVIKELTNKDIHVPYRIFLGYLINVIKMSVGDSIKILSQYEKYFSQV